MFARASRPREGDLVDVGGALVRLKVSARARRVSLRLDRSSGQVLAIAPSAGRLGEAAAFARQRQAWIAARLSERPAPRRFVAGMELVVFGEPCRLRLSTGRASLEADGWERGLRVTVGREVELVGAAAVRLLEGRAVAWFGGAIEGHCAALGVDPPRLSIVDPRARWGSCTMGDRRRAPSIRLSWRLALAPAVVADYVAAHECAHLVEPNHSRRFWAQVERLVGDPAPHRAWLRANSAALHAYQA